MSLCLSQQKKKKKLRIFAHVYLVSSATLNVNLVDAIFIKHYILFIWLVVNIYFPFFMRPYVQS